MPATKKIQVQPR